jgi:hypothetical protein
MTSTKRGRFAVAFLLGAGLLASAPIPAQAYVGPGAGLSVIGALFALVAACALAVVGVIWYPFKKLLRKRKASSVNASEMADKQR